MTVQGYVVISLILLLACATNPQLSPSFYSTTCPNLQAIVRNGMRQAIFKDPRMGASILRLFFHDCFVNGCDASVLLDDTATFIGEKNAFPNRNSIRGFEVIDTIKTNVEVACTATVSCGPSRVVPVGRRDATTASQSAANTNLPPPTANLPTLTSMFAAKGLTASDMTALSGAHTIGQARCTTFRAHIYNDSNIAQNFAVSRQATCPATSGSGDDNLAPLDIVSPNPFDNGYFQDLVARRGLLHSDQELFNGGSQDGLVRFYSFNFRAFANDFVNAMVKMGNIIPLTGSSGEIRKNCRVVN